MGRKRDYACKCGKLHKSQKSLLRCHVKCVLSKKYLIRTTRTNSPCFEEHSFMETEPIKYTLSSPPAKYFYWKKLDLDQPDQGLIIDFSNQKALVDDEKKEWKTFDIVPRFIDDKLYYTRSFDIQYQTPINRQEYLTETRRQFFQKIGDSAEIPSQDIFRAQPKRKYCQGCSQPFENYFNHIELPRHKAIIKLSCSTYYIYQQAFKFKKEREAKEKKSRVRKNIIIKG